MPDEVARCRHCDEEVRWNGQGWIDAFDAYLCDSPRNELHEVAAPDVSGDDESGREATAESVHVGPEVDV